MNGIWIEKHRPREFKEVKGQRDIIEKVKAFVEKKEMPHLLFSGPAGTGKTTTALIIAHELFGESWKENFLELNASDERGIDVVRNKVKDFARTRAIGNVEFKVIYLDESDALTKEAQQALRRTMESYTRTCRFILSCNYVSKIIDPIQSRCAIFRFKPLSKEEIFEIIDVVAKKEALKISSEAKEALFNMTKGDVRRLENTLQSAAVLNKNIDEKAIYSIAAFAKPKEIIEILTLAVSGKFKDSRSLLLKTMLNHGLSGQDTIKQIHQEIWNLDSKLIDDQTKLDLVDKCGEVEFRLTEGSDDFLQLESFLAYAATFSFKRKS